MMARICLITPFHVAFQPRTVREADTLAEAGHDVRVVSAVVDPDLALRDDRLMRRRSWRLQRIDLRRNGPSRGRWLAANLSSRLHRLLYRSGARLPGFAARGYLRGYDHLLAAATAEPADWYIAHTQAALPVAAAAVGRCRASRMGFDCEDLLSDSGTDPSDLVRAVEHAHLRHCDYVSTPSRAIAEELVTRYGITPPVVLHNVFPLHLAEGLAAPCERLRSSPLRLHWSGQTIGAGRGLEEAIDAAALLETPAEIHLRGRVATAYRSSLEHRAALHGSPPKLFFHPILDHDDVIRAMGEFDVGLCLERPENGNAARTVSNKLFSYMLAGLAIAATDTIGQREIMGEIPTAGFSYAAGDSAALARGLSRWQQAAALLLEAQNNAWDAARQRFCWDREAERLRATLDAS